ncbi:MAG: hypothetical protein K5695_15285 [Oscillospiraceae bacterium]|nr:hypothetical protein [Oscillospiraceae bacterium]
MAERYESIPADLRKAVSAQITWPQAALIDASGHFRGYIMQKINGHETLDCAYSESQKAKSDFSFAEKIIIAKNLCVAVNIMHNKLHCVVGDFNAKNIMVSTKKGTVYLVDADSFHLQCTKEVRGRKVVDYMPAVVGRPEYLPKELHEYVIAQNAQLDSLPQPSFNQESDLFGLAIHIFQLLMNGAHPYGLMINPANKTSSISVSKTDISWAENIKKDRYVYSKAPEMIKRILHFQPPKYAPPYDVISSELQDLFERAFVVTGENVSKLSRQSGDGKYMSAPTVRPSASDWYFALKKFSEEVKSCPVNPKHQYSRNMPSCPWCQMGR